MLRDSLGDRMKSYERSTALFLPPQSYYVLRVDGRAFHTVLKDACKPYDLWVARGMDEVAQALCREVQGAVVAYAQSDEVSVIYKAIGANVQQWFGGSVAKQISISASIASVRFSSNLNIPVTFDSRVFTLPNVTEVMNYLVWRQKDCQRNSVSMAAQSEFSHKRLQGLNSDQMKGLLAAAGNPYDNMPKSFKNGRFTSRNEDSHWFSGPAPIFSAYQPIKGL